MTLSITEFRPFEIISVDQHDVACDGGGGALGHPKVFLHIDKDTHQVMCPYCSRLYIYKTAHRAAGHA